ncbi:unnamed protein product [Cyclocybe aegerita]|uniref:Uncharacterized protein n=1 Tax=Cyclocybe aegerita TaxID=1973307 RepID=A0A8S0WV97_CYCAE|nr:unnamed protein product [Cyclocybe aegerita]
MQCTWQKLARKLVARGIGQPTLPVLANSLTRSFLLKPFSSWQNKSPNNLFSRRLFTTAELANTSAAHSVPHFPFPPANVALGPTTQVPHPGNLPTDPSLTPAQLGRAAAYAVDLSIRQGNVTDAYHIVNAVRYAGLARGATELASLRSMDHFKAAAATFTKDVSPRLPSHALLHGLIRLNMAQKAANLSEQMMRAGIRVRCRTLEAIYSSLAQTSNHTAAIRTPMQFSLHSDTVLNLRSSMAKDTSSQFAIRLLMLARQSRQRRSHNMFKTLIKLCILNGEIIVGSLLFGTLVRDWQARQLSNYPTVPAQCETPRPVHNRLKEICSAVDHTFSKHRGEASKADFQEALQALANLAVLLDRQLIPFKHITPLLCSLRNCPRAPNMVWIPDKDGTPRRVQAYAYFHEILARLIERLPTHDPMPPNEKMLPRLDRMSYNTLLHYSLLHRRSMTLAERVLDHMTHLRHEPYELDTVSMNIIARAGTLLRDPKVAQLALSRMQKTPPADSDQQDPLLTLLDIAQQKGNRHTLSTRIAHLIAIGQPNIVVDAVPYLLPGLTRSMYPQGNITMSAEEVRTLQHQHREQGLQHAVYLGPVILTSILNALQKAGRTGLAEKVWEWTKKAEALSWTPGDDGSVRPWCIPVHAYTIMIKVYAAETRRENLAKAVGWGGERFHKRSSPQKTPRQLRQARATLGRQLGLETYHAMQAAAARTEQKLAELHDLSLKQNVPVSIAKRELEIPLPDARFFNAILEIVGCQPGMNPRRQRSRSFYRHQIGLVRERFIWDGKVSPRGPDLTLKAVVRHMISEGFPVPLLYQKLLVGRWDGPAPEGLDHDVHQEKDMRPFAAYPLPSVDDKKGDEVEKVPRVMLPIYDKRSFSPHAYLHRQLKRMKRRPGAFRKVYPTSRV